MRLFVSAVMMMLFAAALVPVQAQGTLTQGAYLFTFSSGSFSTTGTWTSATVNSEPVYQTASSGATLTFQATGDSIVIWRLVRTSGPQSMTVFVNGTPNSITNFNTTFPISTFQAIVFNLTGGTDTITITQSAGTVTLHYMMILSAPSSAFPTPVPTATAVPTSTPAFTATPGPSPTPQPTSTPAPTVTPLSVIWALDPEKSYGSTNGQISAVEYGASAADIHIANLLTLLIVSVWGFFIFAVFVLVKYRVDKK